MNFRNYPKPVTKHRAEIIRKATENRVSKINREKTKARRRREYLQDEIRDKQENEL